MIIGLSMAHEVSPHEHLREHTTHSTSLRDSKLSDCQGSDDPKNIDRVVRLRLNKVRDLCGDLCNTSKTTGKKGLYFDETSSQVTCSNIFDDIMDAPREQRFAPKCLPATFVDDFSMNGRVMLKRFPARGGTASKSKPRVFDQVYLGKEAQTNVWTRDIVEKMKGEAVNGSMYGNYGNGEVASLINATRKAGIRDKHVLVIGSENPWVEAICLANGARHVTTLEYGHIDSQHPDVSSILPSELNKMFRDGVAPKFDAVVTFSSLEHSGLGRYGDALNPWGDIISIARAWCTTTNDATLTIGVPWGPRDEIQFNAHRIYSTNRYLYLTSNWKAFSREENKQRIFNFKKIPPI